MYPIRYAAPSQESERTSIDGAASRHGRSLTPNSILLVRCASTSTQVFRKSFLWYDHLGPRWRGRSLMKSFFSTPMPHSSRQRVFRGFRGRVAAQRWALKRAEIEALKSVLHEAAVNVQRAYRGHLGRVEASEVKGRQSLARKYEQGDSRPLLMRCWTLTSVAPCF